MFHIGRQERWIGEFLPLQDDNHYVSGELTYDAMAGISLRTSEQLASPRLPGLANDRDYPALKGHIQGGLQCTVLEAFDTSVGGTFQTEIRNIIGNYLLLGHWADGIETLEWSGLTFRSAALTCWWRPQAVKVAYRKGPPRKATVTCAAPKPLRS